MKNKTASSTHKRVAVALFEGPADQGYVNPASLGHDQAIELLTRDGEHKAITIDHVEGRLFRREFTECARTGAQDDS